MNRVRFFFVLVTVMTPLLWPSNGIAQTSTKDDGLVKIAKTIIQKASESSYFELINPSSCLIYLDPDPDETATEMAKRIETIKGWAKSLNDMERNVHQDPNRFKGVSYKNFIVKRELDEKGKPLLSVKVRFEVPAAARAQLIPPGTAVIEWRLIFANNARLKKDRAPNEPDWQLVRVDQVTPASAGVHF